MNPCIFHLMKKSIFCAMMAFGGMCGGDNSGWVASRQPAGPSGSKVIYTKYTNDRDDDRGYTK